MHVGRQIWNELPNHLTHLTSYNNLIHILNEPVDIFSSTHVVSFFLIQNIMETIITEYEELKKDQKYMENRKRLLFLHNKLAEYKRLIRDWVRSQGNTLDGGSSSSGCSSINDIELTDCDRDSHKKIKLDTPPY